MNIKWTEEYITGIGDIDLQHQELFERAGAFIEACDKGKCKEEVDHILKYLEDYTVVHFAAEERLQKNYGYPLFPSHKVAHEEFLNFFSQLKQRYEKEGPNQYLALLTYDFMLNWFLKHIASMDKALCQFLKAKNQA